MKNELYSTIDVAIGVVLLLIIVSMLVSIASEYIAGLMKWRSKDLKKGIRNLLSDPDDKGLAGLIFRHSLIQSLGRARGSSQRNDPSYIPADRFAQALIDVIPQMAARGSGKQGVTCNGVVLARRGTEPDGQIRNADASVSLAARGDDTDRGVPNLGAELQDVRLLVASLPEGEVRRSLMILANQAEGNMDAFTRNVAAWFDDSMDRVSGWYKRKTQICQFILASCIVVLLNADILNFASTLRSQPKLAAEVVSIAEKFVEKSKNTKDKITDAQAAEVRKAINRLNGLSGLPLGWERGAASQFSVWAVPGWFFTALLASLGAPFWFNVLGQLLDIRSAGRTPAKPKRDGPLSPNTGNTLST